MLSLFIILIANAGLGGGSEAALAARLESKKPRQMKPHVTPRATGKLICTKRELKRKDCRLAYRGQTIRLLADTIGRNDGTWNTVDPMPIKGETASWEKIKVSAPHDPPVIELWIWDAGGEKTDALVENLHWIVVRSNLGKLEYLSDETVRRRRPKEKGYIYDGWEKHSLKVNRDGEMEIRVGDSLKKIPAPKTILKGHPHGV